MKRNYFLKLLAFVMFMAFAVTVQAREISVANGATDSDLAAALEQADHGDVILINGWVIFDAQVHVEKNVTIRGVGNAGFDAEGNSRLFEIDLEPVEGAKLVFENLGFMGGNAWKSEATDGGVARIFGGSVVEFIDCYFWENEARRGGAFFITGEADGQTTTVSFTNCDAQFNIAYGDGGESRGGYLFTDGNTHIEHAYCMIANNQSIGGRGGALCLFGSGTRRFFNTVISNNLGGKWDDDETMKLDMNGNEVSGNEYEGGVAFITGGATTFEACGLIANKSWSHAGLIRSWGDANITFINSVVSKNRSLHDRPPIWTGPATYTFVNTFFVDNQGQNQGNGAGFDGDNNASVRLNIFNSVFARNVAGGDGAVDIRALPNYANQLTVKNSLIGLIQGNDSQVVPIDNPNIPTKSDVRMYKVADEPASLDYYEMEYSGIDFDEGINYSMVYGMPYYLLQAGSPVTRLGDPALLADYDLDCDMFGQTITVAADGSISASPTIATTPRRFDENTTGIDAPKVTAVKDDITIIGAVSNGILGVDFGNLKGHAKGTLVNIAGQEVERVFDIIVVGKGYYNISAAPGMYILKVEIGGKMYAQKLIVTK